MSEKNPQVIIAAYPEKNEAIIENGYDKIDGVEYPGNVIPGDRVNLFLNLMRENGVSFSFKLGKTESKEELYLGD